MTAPTASEIKARYPALFNVPDTQVDMAIADAAPWFDVARWGDFYSQGVAAFVAHMLTLDGRANAGTGGAAAGPLSMKKVGDVQVQYAAPTFASASDSFYATTVYGQRYLTLRRLVGIGAVSV